MRSDQISGPAMPSPPAPYLTEWSSSRRSVIRGIAASGMNALLVRSAIAAPREAGMTPFRTVVRGLRAPESPKVLADGSVLVCEMASGTLARVTQSGAIERIADVGGSPNGVALGRDGAAYVCNNGGAFAWARRGELLVIDGPPNVKARGSIQKVDLATGRVTTLYESVDGSPLRGPNDIVFDERGDLWFTDLPGNAVYWARADGREIRRVCSAVTPNGIAISPDGRTLYIAQTARLCVAAYRIADAGRLVSGADGEPIARIAARCMEGGKFDSMAVEADGGLVVGTLDAGCLSLFTASGRPRGTLFLPERNVTSLAFGGVGLRTAYVTLTTTGILAAIAWPRRGLRLS